MTKPNKQNRRISLDLGEIYDDFLAFAKANFGGNTSAAVRYGIALAMHRPADAKAAKAATRKVGRPKKIEVDGVKQ